MRDDHQSKLEQAVCRNLGISADDFASSAMRTSRFTSDAKAQMARRAANGDVFGVSANLNVNSKDSTVKAALRHVEEHVPHTSPLSKFKDHIAEARTALESMGDDDGDDAFLQATRCAGHLVNALSTRITPVSVDAEGNALD